MPCETTAKLEIAILTHGASSHQVDHEDSPGLSGEQSCMDHLYWNTIHLETNSESKPALDQAFTRHIFQILKKYKIQVSVFYRSAE